MKFTHILLFATFSMFALPAFSQSSWDAADMDESQESFRPEGRKERWAKVHFPIVPSQACRPTWHI